MPSVVAAYSVVGERQQGTREPLLTTPIPREEFLLGKALAALLPSFVVSLLGYAFFVACVGFFARPTVASAVFQGPALLAQVLFTPLLATWSIWVGIAISRDRATSASHSSSAVSPVSGRSRSRTSSRST